MTNEEAKLQAIKNAYGENWDKVKKYVTKEGWIANKYLGSSDFVLYEPFHKEGYWDEDLKKVEAQFRPAPLSGIDNNNGWIRINSVDDLPKENAIFWVIQNNEIVDMENWEIALSYHNRKDITHYQPITKPKPPIY